MRALLLLPMTGALLAGLTQETSQAPTVGEILEAVSAAYTACNTYQDSGTVTTVFIQEGRRWSDRKPFTTAFVRPDRFRFEYRSRLFAEEFDRHIIWRDGGDVRRWWDIDDGLPELETLALELGAAAGVSCTTSTRVPSLLFPEEFRDDVKSWLVDLTENAELVETAEAEGVMCHRIAVPDADRPITVWIDVGNHLIRRIYTEATFDDFRTERTIVYDPLANGEVCEDMLRFDPGPLVASTEPPKVEVDDRVVHGSPTPQEILRQVEHAYSSCETYEDAGSVETVFVTGERRRTARKTFKTAFIRPDQFRFEFQKRVGAEDFESYIIWKDGALVKTWWDLRPGVQTDTSLSMAVAGAAGISSGSSHTVPRLLLPEETEGHVPVDLNVLTRVQDASIGAIDCFRVKGTNRLGDPVTIWVDKGTFLIRRIDSTKEFDDFHTIQTTLYEPRINEEITEAALAFDAPRDR